MNKFSLKSYFDSKTIALVGPSPHLLKKNIGSFLDSFDLIVRVNEVGINSNLYKDYGSRTDIAFLTLTDQSKEVYKTMIKKTDTNNLKLVIHPRDAFNQNPFDNAASSTTEAKKIFDELEISVDYHQVLEPPFNKICNMYNSFPTTGALAIQELIKYDYKKLYVCGFSFFTTKFMYNDERKIFQNSSPSKITKHNIRRPGHNIKNEVKVIRRIIDQHNKKNISGDYMFRRIIMSKTRIYYLIKRFTNYYLNFDAMKNLLKLFFRWLKNI